MIVSALELVKNPVAWFAKKNWLVKLGFILLLVPLISAVAIVSYLQTSQVARTESLDETTLHQELLSEQQKQKIELTAIREDLATLVSLQKEKVLGVEDELPRKDSAETKVIYLPEGAKNIPVYEKPSTNSAQVSQVKAGSVFFYLEKENNWYLITMDNQQSAWIRDDQLIELF